MKITENVRKRFWAKVKKTDQCWLWTAAKGGHGYGELNIDGNPVLAHRLAWILTRGPIPDGLQICHVCDNRGCVCPDHLFLGTQADNIHDMIRKGRQSRGVPQSTQRKGEKNSNAKLTAEQVKEIRKRYKAGGVTMKELGKEYGVVRHTIGNIVRYKLWPHIS